MPRVEKQVTKEEFDHFVKNYKDPLRVEENKIRIPKTNTYIRGTIELIGYEQSDIVAIHRKISQDQNHPGTEDEYFIYEEQ